MLEGLARANRDRAANAFVVNEARGEEKDLVRHYLRGRPMKAGSCAAFEDYVRANSRSVASARSIRLFDSSRLLREHSTCSFSLLIRSRRACFSAGVIIASVLLRRLSFKRLGPLSAHPGRRESRPSRPNGTRLL